MRTVNGALTGAPDTTAAEDIARKKLQCGAFRREEFRSPARCKAATFKPVEWRSGHGNADGYGVTICCTQRALPHAAEETTHSHA